MDLVFMGTQKTATTSFFEMLAQHPEIAESWEKEYYNKFVKCDHKRYVTSNDYDLPYSRDAFNITQDSKVMMDGSPGLFNFLNEGVLEKIKTRTQVRNIKCIYLLRSPLDRFVSSINFRLQLQEEKEMWHYRFPKKTLHRNGKLVFDRGVLMWLILKSDINNLYSIETTFSRENMLICKMKDAEKSQADIYKFLGVDPSYRFTMGHKNKTKYVDEEMMKKVRKNRKFINQVCIQSLRSIKSVYGIETDDLILDVLKRKV